VSIGVLASVFSAALVDEVIEEAGVREVRHRRLPARLMVYDELALAVTGRAGLPLGPGPRIDPGPRRDRRQAQPAAARLLPAGDQARALRYPARKPGQRSVALPRAVIILRLAQEP
jgi:hypothetical protein